MMAFHCGTVLASIITLPLGFMGRACHPVGSAIFRAVLTRRCVRCVPRAGPAHLGAGVRACDGARLIAGILAIFVSDVGGAGQAVFEAIENADRGQVDGVRSTGASRRDAASRRAAAGARR